MKKALIIAGKDVEDREFFYSLYRLNEENYHIDVATKDGKNAAGKAGIPIKANKSFDDIKVDDYDLLILPGGTYFTDKMRLEQKLLEFIKEWDDKNKIIGCICHGPQLLISANVLDGRHVTAYWSIKDDIINAGGTYTREPFVIDKNIISAPHYDNLGEWMREVLRVFKERIHDKKSITV